LFVQVEQEIVFSEFGVLVMVKTGLLTRTATKNMKK
jgi:hypothetical protein